MPPGGDGYYYVSVYLQSALFDVELNEDLLCTARSDLTGSSPVNEEITSCAGVTYAIEGICRPETFRPPY